ncbi:MAG: DUF697 domain-containing protein, partial [Spirochaetales bacterium]|nr:DUF697 domain-containing protein [Spirochaetales bacterium]
TFYGFILFLIIFGIIYPIVKVFFAPVFSLNRLHDKKGRAKLKWCHRLVKNVVQNCDLTVEEKNEIRQCFRNNKDEIDDAIIDFFKKNIAPKIYSEAFTTAKNVCVVTAVSQKSSIDMIATVTAQFSLVKRIVEICGFRPTTPALVNLYLKVMMFTLLAGSLEEADLETLLPLCSGTFLEKIGGVFVVSAIQGIINAYTTLRVAMITKHLLFDSEFSSQKEIIANASSDAHKILFDILISFPKNGVLSIWDKIKSLVMKPFSKKPKNDITYTKEIQRTIPLNKG